MEEITNLIKSLIQFQTVPSRPDEINRCADFIGQYLSSEGIQFRRLNYENTPSILVVPKNTKPPLLLMAHFDVVDGKVDQFQPRQINGHLFGRGSLDDKYAVAVSLVLLKEYVHLYRKKGLTQEDLPFGILLTGDEETGGENGANKALAEVKPDFCITLDGGALNEIITKEKGIAQIKLISRGRSSHGSRPWLGQNAIESLINDYQLLCNFFDLTNFDNWHRTMNLAKIEAGQAINQVPMYAEAVLDIRYTENDNIEELISAIRKTVKSELEVLRIEPLFKADPSPYLDLLLTSNPGLKTGSEHGSSDARFLSMHGINGIVWGADGNLSHHSEEEHVNLDSVFALYQKLNQFIQKSSEIN